MSEAKFLGSHLLFAPEASGTSTNAVKPAVGSFASVGRLTRIRFSPNVDVREIIAPYPGGLRRMDALGISRTTDFVAHVTEIGPVFWQLVFGTLALTAGSAVQYNPHEAGTGTAIPKSLLKGWCKIQQYDETGVLYNTVDLWSAMKIDADVDFGENEHTYDIRGYVCESTLNTGVIATLA